MFIGGSGRDSDDEETAESPAYYWWFLANLLAISFALLSWIFCLHIFENPEIPKNYKILEKLNRLPEMERFKVQETPKSLSLTPSELYGKYFGVGEEKRERLNSLLIRNYINSFENKSLLTYIEGSFQVLAIRPLEGKDIFSPGLTIRAQAMVSPDDYSASVPFPVFVEFLFPTLEQPSLAGLKGGDLFAIKGNPHRVAVLNVSRTVENDEPSLQLTAVPIAYGNKKITQTFSLKIEPPASLNLTSNLPIWE